MSKRCARVDLGAGKPYIVAPLCEKAIARRMLKFSSIILAVAYALSAGLLIAQEQSAPSFDATLLERQIEEEGYPGKEALSPLGASADSTYLQMSTQTDLWDTLTDDWAQGYRIVYQYDSLRRQSGISYQDWTGTQWLTHDRESHSYDDENNKVAVVFQILDGGVFRNASRIATTYTPGGLIDTRLSQDWRDSAWVDYVRDVYAYDADGWRISRVHQGWDGIVWSTRSQSTYTRNELGGITMSLSQRGSGGDLVNYSKVTYAYDAYNYRSDQAKFVWREDAWVLTSRFRWSSAYDKNRKPLTRLREKWRNSSWETSGRSAYVYDDRGRTVRISSQARVDSTWEDRSQLDYWYDAGGNQTVSSTRVWEGNIWRNTWRQTMVWERLLTAADEVPARYHLRQNYPNPFNPVTTLSYSVSAEQFVSLIVYDILGREAARLVEERKEPGRYSVVWNAAGFPSGVYICRMAAGAYAEAEKMILLR